MVATEAHAPTACAPQREATAVRSPRSTTGEYTPPATTGEKAHAKQQRPSTAKDK